MAHFLTLLQENNLLSTVVRLLLAAVLGGLIGTERGAKGRAAGMRTHIIVCIGAAMTALVGLYTTDVLGQSSDPMRLSAQVISGIGFLGGGMILIRGRHRITGLTTAAGPVDHGGHRPGGGGGVLHRGHCRLGPAAAYQYSPAPY